MQLSNERNNLAELHKDIQELQSKLVEKQKAAKATQNRIDEETSLSKDTDTILNEKDGVELIVLIEQICVAVGEL